MRILAVSDNVLAKLEDRDNLLRNYGEVCAVVSCGDMPAHYLEFITDVLGVPLLYVRGNHDIHYTQEHPGGDNLHGRVVNFGGLLWAGLEGCLRYNREPIQYTQSEMLWQVLRLYPAVLVAQARFRRRLDIMVTHAPPRHIHDLPDRAHTGFTAFRLLMRLYRPRYLLHGHVDTHDAPLQRTHTRFLQTEVINVNPARVLDFDKL
ncbi:MAG: hypothetical protein NZ571_14690 [Anaerolineae bacterium]|nr:hypothetical protein [Anaerolineae bacterium]